MDDRLKKALDFSNFMISLNNQKRLIVEQYQNDLIYYYNGGQFTATQQLISFCKILIDLNQTEALLIDDSGTPVEVENIQVFLESIVDVYFKASNKYLTEFVKLKKNRTVPGIVE